VLVPHGADGDRIDLRIIQHLPIVAIEFGDAELPAHLRQPLRGAGAEGRQLQVRYAGDGFGMDLPEPAEADHAHPQSVHGVLLQKSSSVSSRDMTMFPAVRPQSTGMAAPVTALAASEARKAMTRATSPGSTILPSGYQRSRRFRTSGSRA